jgi:DNA repair protein RadC
MVFVGTNQQVGKVTVQKKVPWKGRTAKADGESPRERLLRYGAQVLRNDELLAVLMQSGNGQASVHELAARVLDSVSSLHALLDTQVEELMRIPGIGLAKALQIAAAVELGRRIVRRPADQMVKIRSADDAAEYVMDRMRHLKKEHFVTLHLNTKHCVIGEEVVSVGSLDASIVHPREIFKLAVKRSASAILCVHNHPSGDPTPSPEDIAVTKRLLEAGRVLGIDVLDHIVIGDGHYVSLKAAGYMTNRDVLA